MLKKLMAIGVFFALAPFGFGQQGSIPKELTLHDCIGVAMQRNSTLLQAKFQSESQDARVMSAYGGLLPSLSGSAQFQYAWRQSPAGYVVIGGTSIPVSNSSTSRTYSGGVSADYTLFNGFANYATVNQANSASQSADLNYRRSKQTVINQTTINYLTVFNARDQLKINEDNLKRDQQQLESIKEQNSVGSASLADVYQQQAIVSNDEYSLVTAKNAYDQAQANLKFYLGIPVTDSVTFADAGISSELDTTQFQRVNENFSNSAMLIEKALQSRPDYQAAVENVNAYKSSLSIAEAAYSPTISAFGTYGINGPQTTEINQNKSFYGGLSLSLPIFNGFQTQTNIQIADVNVKSAKQSLENTRRQVQLDVYQALLSLHAAEKQYESAVTAVSYAKINLETYQEKYKIGSATLLDVLTANALYTQDLSNRVIAAYTYIQAKQQVEYAIGTINY
ncbi:MAG: TolC family protein [Bacteroidetes bacterium]|nr:TolC family protein [Bacteroidota bacterium]